VCRVDFDTLGGGWIRLSVSGVTAQTFVEIEENIFSLFFSSFVSGKWRKTRRGNGIRRHPVSLARRVCHGGNNSVPPTGTSNG
jgi:hypothetical protein